MICISTGSKSPDPVIWKSMLNLSLITWLPRLLGRHQLLRHYQVPRLMCLEGLPALLVLHVGQLNMSYMLTDLHIFVGIFDSDRERKKKQFFF